MKWFSQQFPGKKTLLALFAIITVHILAVLSVGGWSDLVILFGVAILTFAYTYRRLEVGLCIAFLELFVGGHGHLFVADVYGFSLSLRMAIFFAVLFAWFLLFVQNKVTLHFSKARDLPWIILAAAVLVGSVIGFATNSFSAAFDDMNGYLYGLYLLPLISVRWNATKKRELLQVLAAASIWLTIFTIGLSYLFTHLSGEMLSDVYRFVRDSRLAEVTLQTVSNSNGEVVHPNAAILFGEDGYWYRVFMQNHLITTLALLLLLAGSMVWKKKEVFTWKPFLAIAFLVSVLPISMSRSFLLALFASLCILAPIILWHIRPKVKTIVLAKVSLIFSVILGLGIAWASITIPVFNMGDLSSAAFYNTSADASRELAVSSRWQLLGPMNEEILSSPILGSGFGEEVTFISDDPRVRAENPSGEWTTYRFEWGYQDIWLKMGILGLIAFILYAISLTRAAFSALYRKNDQWIAIGLFVATVCVYVVHVFTPFLNHPIGIGWLLFVLPFFPWKRLETSTSHVKKRGVFIASTAVKPVMQRDG